MKNDTKIILKLSVKILAVAVLAAMSLYNLFHGTTICVESETIYLSSSDDAHLIVNINTATARELKKLDGIGRVTAQAIIDYCYDIIDMSVRKNIENPTSKWYDVNNDSNTYDERQDFLWIL